MVQQQTNQPDIQPQGVNRDTRDAESAIRARFDEFSRAFISKDIDQILSFYTDDVVAFDIAPPLQFVGKDDYRKSWEKYMPEMDKVDTHEIRDLKILTGGDLAVSYCLSHMGGTMKKDNKHMDCWFRHTAAWRRVNNQWLICHEQLSVPIEMDSDKPLWDLKPEGLAH